MRYLYNASTAFFIGEKMFPSFEFLGRTIGTYGLCSVAGILFSVFVAVMLGKRYKYAFEDILLLTLSICAGILVGGHLLYGVTNAGNMVSALKNAEGMSLIYLVSVIASGFGGMVFYGGFLGGAAAVVIYSKHSKALEYPNTMDLYAAVIPLFHTFGRIGCFLGGCCYGKEWPWGFAVRENPYIPEMAGPVRIPVQLIEAGCNLIIFIVIAVLFIKNKYSGKLIFIYMLLYPVARFILEFFRGDELRGILFGISTSQYISIILFAFALGRLFFSNLTLRKPALKSDKT